MKYFYVISNLSKDYVLDVQDEVQNCLEKRGAVCRFMTGHERMKNGRHTPSEYVPEDTQCIITIGGDGTLVLRLPETWQGEIYLCWESTGDIWAF